MLKNQLTWHQAYTQTSKNIPNMNLQLRLLLLLFSSLLACTSASKRVAQARDSGLDHSIMVIKSARNGNTASVGDRVVLADVKTTMIVDNKKDQEGFLDQMIVLMLNEVEDDQQSGTSRILKQHICWAEMHEKEHARKKELVSNQKYNFYLII